MVWHEKASNLDKCRDENRVRRIGISFSDLNKQGGMELVNFCTGEGGVLDIPEDVYVEREQHKDWTYRCVIVTIVHPDFSPHEQFEAIPWEPCFLKNSSPASIDITSSVPSE